MESPEKMPSVDELVARAIRLDTAADKAFRRWFEGEVQSSSGAASLRSKADEAWADVRFHPDYDEERHSERAVYDPYGVASS